MWSDFNWSLCPTVIEVNLLVQTTYSGYVKSDLMAQKTEYN
jgi:hypothetical protein